MSMLSSQARYVLDHPWRFAGQVIRSFRANQGFLLSGAVAYNTLLSIVPMFALNLLLGAQIIAQYERIGQPPAPTLGLQT